MPEKDLQECVRRTALAFGWLFFHPFDSRKSTPGFPDCSLTKDGRLLFIELKTERGKPTEAQWRWLGELAKVPGVRVFLFRPSHWYDGTIERVLRGGEVEK